MADTGYNMTMNRFCVIDADFRHEAILRELPGTIVRSDVCRSRGIEVPDVSTASNGKRFVALKKVKEDGDVSFWGDRDYFVLWDGEPCHFDYND